MEEVCCSENDTATIRGYFHEIMEMFSPIILLATISNVFTCDFTRNTINPSKYRAVLPRAEGLRAVLQPFQGLEVQSSNPSKHHIARVEGLRS